MPGAATYLGRIQRVVDNAPDANVAGGLVFTQNTSLTFPESLLEVGPQYRSAVFAFSAAINPSAAATVAVPAQFNASIGLAPNVLIRTP